MSQHVFVYGSLKRGHWNNVVLGNSKLVAEAITVRNYALTDCGFPYLIPEEAVLPGSDSVPAPVVGEVYEVSSEAVMADLDRLEGVKYGHYEHHHTKVVGDDGVTYDVLAYVPCSPVSALNYPLCGRVKEWAGGLLEKEVYQWRG